MEERTFLMHSFCRMALAVALIFDSIARPSFASTPCKILKEATFAGDGEKVRLAGGEGSPDAAEFAVFKAPLAVNTDGAPTSYHPEDFLGERLAINRIDNGIAIRRDDGTKLNVAAKRAAFDLWRRSDWKVPAGFQIRWKNVIADNGSGAPCVFQRSGNKGYFGSLTALKNGLEPAQAGECQARNQLDLRVVPAIALRGKASDPLQSFGARTGDLVLAVNPASRKAVGAVIGDTGDGDRIGEGSVALNMALLDVVDQPRNYQEAKLLDTGTKAQAVAVILNSKKFELERPYTAANLEGRLSKWAAAMNYGSINDLAELVLACAEGL